MNSLAVRKEVERNIKQEALRKKQWEPESV